MTNIWDQTIEIDINLARDLIKSQTNLDVKNIKLIGQGFDNLAYLVNEEYIFRFPRRESGVECLENEINILPYIAKHVSFPITSPKFIGKTDNFPFAGYPILKGEALYKAANPFIESKDFAGVLGEWLKELHSVKILESHNHLLENNWRLNIPNRVEALTANVHKYQEYYLQSGFSIKKLLDVINGFNDIPGKATLSRDDSALQVDVIPDESAKGAGDRGYQEFLHKPCYLHGDLYFCHIIVDQNIMPAGVIDWGDTHIGHPGIDISAVMMILSEKSMDEFFNSYGRADDEIMQVAKFRAICHDLSCLPYAWMQNDKQFKNWCIASLKRLIG